MNKYFWHHKKEQCVYIYHTSYTEAFYAIMIRANPIKKNVNKNKKIYNFFLNSDISISKSLDSFS